MDGDLEKKDTDGCCKTFWKDIQRYWVWTLLVFLKPPFSNHSQVNDGTKTILVILYLLGNAAIFMERLLSVLFDTSNLTLMQILSLQVGRRQAILWALRIWDSVCQVHKNFCSPCPMIEFHLVRGAAAALKLNCACVLIPVLRNFLCWYILRLSLNR